MWDGVTTGDCSITVGIGDHVEFLGHLPWLKGGGQLDPQDGCARPHRLLALEVSGNSPPASSGSGPDPRRRVKNGSRNGARDARVSLENGLSDLCHERAPTDPSRRREATGRILRSCPRAPGSVGPVRRRLRDLDRNLLRLKRTGARRAASSGAFLRVVVTRSSTRPRRAGPLFAPCSRKPPTPLESARVGRAPPYPGWRVFVSC